MRLPKILVQPVLTWPPNLALIAPRATDGGNKDGAAHHCAVILALWSSHCRAKTRPNEADSADSADMTKICFLFSVVSVWPVSHTDTGLISSDSDAFHVSIGGGTQHSLKPPHVCY